MAKQETTKPHYIHRMSYSTQEKIVGLFVVGALFVFLSLFVINSRNLHLFEDYINLDLYVASAEGVALDTPVRIAGISVGRVEQVEITDEHMIRIRVRIYDRYTSMLRTDSVPSITLSLLGRTSIDFSTGNPNLPLLEDGTALQVESPLSIEDLMARVTPLMEGVQDALHHLTELILVIDEGEVAQLLTNTTAITGHLAAILGGIERGEGLAGKFVKDDAFAQQVEQLLGSVDATLQQTERRLAELEPLLVNLDPVLQQLAEASPYIPDALRETVVMLEHVNHTLTSLQPEVQGLPEMMIRVNILLEQTDLLMNKVMGTWPLNIGTPAPRKDVELIPHD